MYLWVSESESGHSLLTTFCFQAMANQKNGDLKKGAKMACFKMSGLNEAKNQDQV